MLVIEDTTISLTRGDTAYLALDLTSNGEPYELDDYQVDLTVREGYEPTDKILFKKTVINSPQIVIEPADTNELAYGRYKYDIQITTSIGEIFTVVVGTFKITEEVTQ